MDTDLDTLATALFVTTDDLLTAHPERVPAPTQDRVQPQISDAELLTLAVMQAPLGFAEETRFLRYARKNLLSRCAQCPLGQRHVRVRLTVSTKRLVGNSHGNEIAKGEEPMSFRSGTTRWIWSGLRQGRR